VSLMEGYLDDLKVDGMGDLSVKEWGIQTE